MRVDVRPIGALEANCYIIDARVMIDPGDSAPELDSFMRDTNADISAAVITHGHFDHMLGAAHIKERCKCEIYISEADAKSLWDEKTALCLPYAVSEFKPMQPDVILNEGKTEIAGIPFEVMLTPGHTPGGLCLISHESKCVFTGDTLFKYGYGRTDLAGGDMRALLSSLRRILSLPKDYRIYPGHGESALIGEIIGQ